MHERNRSRVLLERRIPVLELELPNRLALSLDVLGIEVLHHSSPGSSGFAHFTRNGPVFIPFPIDFHLSKLLGLILDFNAIENLVELVE